MPKIILSSRACSAISVETINQHPNETGGILLGHITESAWYIIESIDPGPKSVFTPWSFEYDAEYVNHLAKKVSAIYSSPLSILGLWHRHPESYDQFSGTDDITNRRYVETLGRGVISCIVNIDPDIRITAYHVSKKLAYTRETVTIDDGLIPQKYFAVQHPTLPLDDDVKNISLEAIYSGLFNFYYRQSEPLDCHLLAYVEPLLEKLDQLKAYAYALKACGSCLQVALLDQSCSHRYLLELIYVGQSKPELRLNGRTVPQDNPTLLISPKSVALGHMVLRKFMPWLESQPCKAPQCSAMLSLLNDMTSILEI